MPALKPALKRLGLHTCKYWNPNQPVRVQMPDGLSFKISGDNYLTQELFWRGGGYYEPISTLLVRELVQPGDTFFDVGANIGFYSLVLSAAKPGLRVVAFEPNPRIYRLLARNVALNGFSDVTCEPRAMSDREGTANLFLAPSDMSASLRNDFETQCTQTVEVNVTTLDAYLVGRSTPGRMLIKVDVEGHEAAFFRGARATITRAKPDIVMEVTLDFDPELMQFLRALGYSFYPITDQGLLPSQQVGPVVRGRLVFLNYLISARPRAELAEIFHRIAKPVREINLSQTSKYLSEEAVKRFTSRAEELAAAGRR